MNLFRNWCVCCKVRQSGIKDSAGFQYFLVCEEDLKAYFTSSIMSSSLISLSSVSGFCLGSGEVVQNLGRKGLSLGCKGRWWDGALQTHLDLVFHSLTSNHPHVVQCVQSWLNAALQ